MFLGRVFKLYKLPKADPPKTGESGPLRPLETWRLAAGVSLRGQRLSLATYHTLRRLAGVFVMYRSR